MAAIRLGVNMLTSMVFLVTAWVIIYHILYVHGYNISSENGLAPTRRQASIWTHVV